MSADTRTDKSILNAKVGATCYMLSLLISFFTRGVFLSRFGTEFLGLTSTIGSILSFLNVAELGISTAVCVVLYKPLYDHNEKQISDIVSVLGLLYSRVGSFILITGVIVSFFLPSIFQDTTISLPTLYIGYYAYLFGTLLSYFANYRAVLLSADQRNYLVTAYSQACYYSKILFQLIIAITCASYILYFLVEVIASVINSFILNWKIKKGYPWLRSQVSIGRQVLYNYPSVTSKVRQMFAHQMGAFVQFQSMPLFIYGFSSLTSVALYGNYTLVTNSVRTLLYNVLNSTNASVGNMIAEGDQAKSYRVYRELFCFRVFCAGVVSGCINYLITGFIDVWLGEEYRMSALFVVLLSFHFFLSLVRETTDQFLYAYGLVQDVWSPAVESIIYVATSIVCGYLWGLNGVLLAPIVSLLTVIYCWKPYFLFSQGFHLPIRQYVNLFLKNTLIVISSNVFIYLLFELHPIFGNGWLDWILKSTLFFISLLLLTFGIFLMSSPDFRQFISRFKSIFK